jgi:NADPH:quinone reductase-like Zn-dependent oxidoreductase
MSTPDIPKTMRAAVVHQTGPPEVLVIEQRPVPTLKQGQVLIKVMAAGMNRSEMYTRQGEPGYASTGA